MSSEATPEAGSDPRIRPLDTAAPHRAWPRNIPRMEAPEYLKEEWGLMCARATLTRLASVGGGPIFRKFGRRVVYTTEALDEWAASKLSRPKRSTSDAAQE